MSKKLALVFAAQIVSFVFFSKAGSVFAEVYVNEIFAPGYTSSKQFVEIYNDTGSPVDLTQYKILDSGASKDGHAISAYSGGASLPPQSYGVIAKDPTAISGAQYLFKSNLGIKGGDNIRISDLNSEAQFPASAVSSTDSYQKTSSGWALASPTPGAANSSGSSGSDESPTDEDDDEEESGGSSGSSSASSSTNDAPLSGKIVLDLSVRNIGYVGIPLQFQGRVLQGGQQIYRGRYFWNFGDGDFREVRVINTDKFTHTYFYPGDYTLVFEYYTDSFAESPSASRTMDIKVIDPAVVISRVGDTADFFVELANNTDYAVDVSGWLLLGDNKSFTLPKNTAIAAHRKIIVPGRTSGFTVGDLPMLILATPDEKAVFEYFAYTPPAVQKKKSVRSSEPQQTAGTGPGSEENLPGDIPLQAAVSSLEEDDSSGAPALWFVVFLTFLGTSIWAAHLIRRKRTPKASGEDFELLEE